MSGCVNEWVSLCVFLYKEQSQKHLKHQKNICQTKQNKQALKENKTITALDSLWEDSFELVSIKLMQVLKTNK